MSTPMRMIKRRVVRLALLLCALALTACGGSEVPAESGSVVTGQALAGEQPVAGALVLALDLTGRPAGEARTDAEGRFSLALAPGTYTLAAEAGPGTMGLPAAEVVTVAEGGAPATVILRYAILSQLPDVLSE